VAFDDSIYSTDRRSPAHQIARVKRRDRFAGSMNIEHRRIELPRITATIWRDVLSFLPFFFFPLFFPSAATNLRARGRTSEPAFG
jgi:hypothetical protein